MVISNSQPLSTSIFISIKHSHEFNKLFSLDVSNTPFYQPNVSPIFFGDVLKALTIFFYFKYEHYIVNSASILYFSARAKLIESITTHSYTISFKKITQNNFHASFTIATMITSFSQKNYEAFQITNPLPQNVVFLNIYELFALQSDLTSEQLAVMSDSIAYIDEFLNNYKNEISELLLTCQENTNNS